MKDERREHTMVDNSEQVQNKNITDLVIDRAEQPICDRENLKKFVEGVYVFISFDLTNSTVFKGRHKKIWPAFVSSFYEIVFEAFGINDGTVTDDMVGKNKTFGGFSLEKYVKEAGKTKGFHLWKLLGDEILIYHKITSKEEMYATIPFVDTMRQNIVEKSINRCLTTLFPKQNATDEEKEKKLEYKILLTQYFNIKTTMWIGNCAYDYKNMNSRMPNAIYGVKNIGKNEFSWDEFDFLGPDIDEGFRLSQYSERGVMLVSPKMVCALFVLFANDNDKLNALIRYFKIMNYVSLKGVWEQRPYPLIMFSQIGVEDVDSIEAWKTQFEYDAFENSFLYKNIDMYGENFLYNSRFSVMKLQKIYEDMKRTQEIDDIVAEIEEQTAVQYEPNLLKKPTSFEYHISCLCCDNKGNYWITKHATHGWSFGCVQVATSEYCDYVKEAYKLKYKLEIEVDKSSPILCFYTAKRSEENGGTSILGTIILAKLIKREQDDEIQSQLLSYDECEKIISSDDEKINGFRVALEKAEELKKEKKNEFK